jgi:CheY-like chemotaxis protein/two-component sensor histidine kinase
MHNYDDSTVPRKSSQAPESTTPGDMHAPDRIALAEHRAGRLRAMADELIQTEHRQRRHLAQMLHDGLQQILYVARLTVDRCRRHAENEDLQRLLQQADALLDQALSESRFLTMELSPPILYDSGLPAALDWLASHMRQRHDLGVAVDVDPDCEPLDEQMRVFLFHAVRELLDNVIEHAQTDHATVTVRKDEHEQISVEVADRGVGCDPTHLFGVGSGDGFGLFSIRERLELLGGRIEIQTAPGQGMTVKMLVQVRAASASAESADIGGDGSQGAAPSAVSRAGRALPAGSRIRVALADDHAILRQGLVSLLMEEPDIEIVGEAGNGQEAVELARRMQPDVFLMDVTMPMVDGIEATRQITADLPAVRVVGLSMHDEEGMADAMARAGAAAYLPKGGAFNRLIETIRAMAVGKK